MEQLTTMIKNNLNENEDTKSFSFPTYLFLFYVGENNFTLEKFFSLSEHFQVINVALEILKYPEEANLKQIDIEGKTALYYAIENEMEIIVNDIKKYLF